jgi:hypothetical protein
MSLDAQPRLDAVVWWEALLGVKRAKSTQAILSLESETRRIQETFAGRIIPAGPLESAIMTFCAWEGVLLQREEAA